MGARSTRLDGPTVLAVLITAVVVVAFLSIVARDRPLAAQYDLFLLHNGPAAVVLAWMGRLVLRRRPGLPAGVVLLAIASASAAHVAVAALADARLVAAGVVRPLREMPALAPADLPLDASVPLWVMNWLWVVPAVLAITALPLVFPDGRPPTAARRVVVPAVAGAALLMAAFVIDAWPTVGWGAGDAPAGVTALILAGGLAVLVASATAFAGLAARWRRAEPDGRRRFEAVGLAAAALALVGIAAYPWEEIWVPGVLVTFNTLLVVYALAVARLGIHDLEPVLGRAAVAAALSLLIAAAYLVIVVGAGSLVGRHVDSSVTILALAGVVALLIEPTRRRLRAAVDRVRYRRSADREEVLSRLAARASGSTDASEVVAEVTDLLVRASGAAGAEALLEGDAAAVPSASAGEPASAPPVLRATVACQGERFGELRLHARSIGDLAPDASRLLEDVAHTLGVVLRSDRLRVELESRIDELRTSRRRLVEVHDRTRRDLERDIHDGAQAWLIALRLRIGAIGARLDRGGDRALTHALEELASDVDAAVRSLRDLGRGLHPPILDEAGIAAALTAQARGLPTPVEVTADVADRYPRAVEAAVYFICLEAIQNGVRHSGAPAIRVSLRGDEDGIRFQVRDDGAGLGDVGPGAGIANINDRAAALGGRVTIVNRSAGGVEVAGEIPAQPLVEDR